MMQDMPVHDDAPTHKRCYDRFAISRLYRDLCVDRTNLWMDFEPKFYWIVENFNWSIKTNFMSIDYKLRKYEISYNNDLLIQSGWWYKGIFIYDRKMNRGLIKIVIALFTQTAANFLRRELYHLPNFQNQRQMWSPIEHWIIIIDYEKEEPEVTWSMRVICQFFSHSVTDWTSWHHQLDSEIQKVNLW